MPEPDIVPDLLLSFAVRVALALAILVLGLAIVRLLLRLLRRLLSRSGVDEVFIHFAGSVANILLLTFVVILALDQLGIETRYLFAVLTGLLVALGLALQDSLNILAAGMRLFLRLPFRAGEEVELAGVKGYVDEITMMTTRLHTGDGLDVVVPNSAVVSATIRNYSSRPVRRIDVVVRVGYEDDLRRASEVLLGVLVDDERVLADPPPRVTVAELEPSCVRLNVRPWVMNEDYGSTKNDLSARIVADMRENDIAVAYPQIGVHVEQAG